MSNSNSTTSGGFFDRYFEFAKYGTTMKTEMIAGFTTFVTMAYIIAVNANILSTTGMDKGALVTATCLTATIATFIMAFYAKLPFGLATGMGLNAFFAFTICGTMKVHWQIALAAVFCEGIIFIILSLTKVREAVVNGIPGTMKIAVSSGIGLFIAFIGFKDATWVVADPSTFVTMGTFKDPRAILAGIGIIIVGVLVHRNKTGAILWGIAVVTILAWIYAAMNPSAAAYYGLSTPTGVFAISSISPIAGKVDFSYMTNSATVMNFISIVITILFVDFFDSVGTLVGVAQKAGLVDEEGNVYRAKQALLTDAIGTTIAPFLGTSTVVSYVESAAGVAAGGRTGMTAFVVGILFFIAMFFSPLFVAIPSCATAPALIIVGLFMMQNITQIDFTDYAEGIPAFLTIILMPLTYSIATGLMFGSIAYAVLNLLGGRKNKVSVVMYVLAIIFILRLISTAL